VEVAKVPLALEQRVHLFVKLSLGTPPQTFSCVFDTGSVLLAVFSGNVSSEVAKTKGESHKVMHVEEPEPPSRHHTPPLLAPPTHPHLSSQPPGLHQHGSFRPLAATDGTLSPEAAEAADEKEAAKAQLQAEQGAASVERMALAVSGSAFAILGCVVLSRILYTRLTRRKVDSLSRGG